MDGKEFIRRARRWGRKHGRQIVVESSRGKGGHQVVRNPPHWTTVKTGEIGTGLLSAMLSQLGVPKDEF